MLCRYTQGVFDQAIKANKGAPLSALITCSAEKIPIIDLTANAMQQDIDSCHAAGMDAHVSKPVDKARLVNTLGEFLAHSA